ncbi:MAG: fused MFS/spermidine synthase [Desulfobacterales bacterium]|nr:fused MFS/spermidine synthase [Desulfobacterales bacterium]
MLKIPEKVVYTKNSAYHLILVCEEGFIRSLRLGENSTGSDQSRIDVLNLDKYLLEYTRMVFAGLLLNPAPRRMLIIGLGGGVIPRMMHGYFPKARIDVVEIDQEIVKVARNFFFFQPDERMRVHVADGRMFVQQQAAREPAPAYDMVILDAFNAEYVPFHLVTREFLQLVAAILHPNGVVVANIFATSHIFNEEINTFRAVYGRCHVFSGKNETNTIAVSPGPDVPDLQPDTAMRRAHLLQEEHGFSFNLNTVARQFESGFRPRKAEQILTDADGPTHASY